MSPPGFLNVRLEPALLDLARSRAQLEDRTIASLTRNALRAYLRGEDDHVHEGERRHEHASTA